MKDVYTSLNNIFQNEIEDIPSGMGYFMGDGTEDIFVVYLPYDDVVTGIADNRIRHLTYRLKIDIIARNGKSFSSAENIIKKALKKHENFMYKNGEMSVDTKEPYDYHRVLYYDVHQYFDDIENI